MPSRLNRKISDDEIAELYRRSLLNPSRFTMRLWEGIDYVTSRRFALHGVLVVFGFVVVLIIGWAIRCLRNAGFPSTTPATPKSPSS